MALIDQKLCGTALNECDTSAFEQFVQAFHAALVGSAFVPLGGMHDGGADGFEEQVFESTARASTFLQASKSVDIEGKIKKTIKRLRAFGRNPKVVIFYFSEPVAQVDYLEEEIGNAEDVTVRIRGKQYIESHINASPQTAQAFSSYLRPSIVHLLQIGSTGKDHNFPFEAKTLCAFLGQEINRRRGNATLLTSITDSLILWSLEGTDPEKHQFLTKEEIQIKIETTIPTARHFIRGILEKRLAHLSSKANPTGREISWHRRENVYALRYEQREKLIEENAEELSLYSDVLDSIREQIKVLVPTNLHNRVADIASVVHSCIDATFQKQGLSLGLYFQDRNDEALGYINIADEIESKVDQLSLPPKSREAARDAVSAVLRKLIYSPDQTAREYLLRLSNTYFLLFALKNEPRVVEYFNSMSERLVLYVGSDLIIKALSEHYLPPESRMITNTLDLIKKSGATLIMADPALDEVFSHLHASVLEYENYYSDVERHIDGDFVHLIDRILIRAYFYARQGINTSSRPPANWRAYISQFCNYDDLRRRKNRDSLNLYLCDKFGFEFESKESMLKTIDRDDLAKLVASILNERRNRTGKGTRESVLAYNDALHVLRVYSKRHETGDNTAPNPFGYKTWWLTHEKAVQRASVASLGASKPRSIMRPEFLLNYIALMPSKREVTDSYRAIFPSILGVSLSKRAPEGMLHTVLKSAREAYDVDNSRAKAMLNEFVDKLKTDQLRIYETEY